MKKVTGNNPESVSVELVSDEELLNLYKPSGKSKFDKEVFNELRNRIFNKRISMNDVEAKFKSKDTGLEIGGRKTRRGLKRLKSEVIKDGNFSQ